MLRRLRGDEFLMKNEKIKTFVNLFLFRYFRVANYNNYYNNSGIFFFKS